MRIDRTTLNRNIKPLIEAGFIEVNAGVDPRSRQILLTAEGKSVIYVWKIVRQERWMKREKQM
ncbi:hypothetical protein [Sporomusa acidovorans]|uniref:hypothetical protein n=1 Tax=Sporomusa acidovorans TaxID=112900 RepID=UPI000B2F3F08|nr:hypothetical protein [Sporomusa acidovorans]